MKKIFSMVLLAFVSGSVWAGASTGNCWKKAVSLKASQPVTLVNGWDSDWGEYTDSGVYYYKVTLSRGSAYSVWIEGGDAADMSLSVYTSADMDWESEDFFTAAFEDGSTDDGLTHFSRLASDDWDSEEDPSKITFYVEVSGDIGQKATLNAASGYKNFIPVGAEGNPLAISFSETEKNTGTRDFIDGYFYVETSRLEKGRVYRLKVEGCTIHDETAGGSDDEEEGDEGGNTDEFSGLFNTYADGDYLIIEPLETGYYTFGIAPTNSELQTAFTLYYQTIRERKPADHDVKALSAENAFTDSFVPGRKIANWDFADAVVDENLYSVSVAKGERWVFETEGATTPLYMAVYDKNGNVLGENTSRDGIGYDVRAVLEASAAGTYYVGVCNSQLEPNQAVTGTGVTLTASRVEALEGDPDEWDALDDTAAGATGLEVLPGTAESLPSADGSTHGVHRLSKTDWADTFVIAARKDITYRVGFEFADEAETTSLKLAVKIFTLSGSTEKEIAADETLPSAGGYFEFTAKANSAHYIRCTVAEGKGLDYPGYNVRAVAYATGGADLGILTVNTLGTAAATWYLDRETSSKYPGGSSILVAGAHTITFSAVTGYKTPGKEDVTVAAGTTPTEVTVKYSDTYDPKDDIAKTATAWSLRNTETTQARTLWTEDEEDNFSFTAMDGYFYDFELRNVTGDAVFSITNAETTVDASGNPLPANVTEISQLPLKKTSAKAKYCLVVTHGTEAKTDGSYTLAGKYANVGAIKFSQDKLSVKENAASVKLTVNRSARDGAVRVKYGTVAGSAKPGVDYIAQSGELFWADGDNKAKTLEIKLIPDLVEYDEGTNKQFMVRLEPVPEDERGAGEYLAAISVDTCTVTLTEAASKGTTIADAYEKSQPKLATVKTENVKLETGTFYGVLAEDGFALTNGFPTLASITLTASTAAKAALSAKVTVAGKSYTFRDTGWETDEEHPEAAVKRFELVQKISNVSYTNTLTVAVATGLTANELDWVKAGGTAELMMYIPDANNKGVQEEIFYKGNIYRQNAKIQDYLTVVTNFTGYYTVALAPSGVTVADGIPAGNGYLTLTIDNKGMVKVAGMLPDGSSKPSLSVTAASLVEDAESANGYSMIVPIYWAKKPACFGGVLRLYANEEGTIVVDSTRPLAWHADDTKLSYGNDQEVDISYEPVGGWYDKVVNLQTYYLTAALSVETADISEFPAEFVSAGYEIVTDVQPNGTSVDVAGNAFATDKKTMVRSGSLYDFFASSNPGNVQVKVARATGLVTGSFSLWSLKEDGKSQKEITGFKHNGVLLLSRDAAATADEAVASFGFCSKSLSLKTVNDAGKTVTHSWMFSAPFNVRAVDQGEPDWYADDWYEEPIDGETAED